MAAFQSGSQGKILNGNVQVEEPIVVVGQGNYVRLRCESADSIKGFPVFIVLPPEEAEKLCAEITAVLKYKPGD
jgi:hypothetical protein